MGGVIIISYSTNILRTFFRKHGGIYPTHLDNVLITVFTSPVRGALKYALSDRCECQRLQIDHRAFTARLVCILGPMWTPSTTCRPQVVHCPTWHLLWNQWRIPQERTSPLVSSLCCDTGVGKCIWVWWTRPAPKMSACSSLATTAIKIWFWSALLLSTGLTSSATLQRCLLKLLSAFWTVLRVFVSSALRMLLWSTWTTIRPKRVCAFFHDSWRRPLINVNYAITLFILIDVDVAIILFINTVYTPKLKVQQRLQQQF